MRAGTSWRPTEAADFAAAGITGHVRAGQSVRLAAAVCCAGCTFKNGTSRQSSCARSAVRSSTSPSTCAAAARPTAAGPASLLSADNRRQLYIPRGFAHGFQVLSEQAVFAYKCDDVYHPEDEGGIRWDDTDIGIVWPGQDTPILSEKDQHWPALRALGIEL